MLLNGLHGLVTSWRLSRQLDEVGFERPARVRWGTWIFFWIVVGAAVIASILPANAIPRPGVPIEGMEVGRILLATGGIFIALEQWIAARQEVSLDRFYDRLDRANKMLGECTGARALMHDAWRDKEVYEPAMYACVELDNLEYAIEKYSLGYMTTRNAHRALRTFSARCERSRGFRDQVREAVVVHGYNPRTASVATRIIASAEAEDQRLATQSGRHRNADDGVKRIASTSVNASQPTARAGNGEAG